MLSRLSLMLVTVMADVLLLSFIFIGHLLVSSAANTSPVCPSTFYSITVPEDTVKDSVIFTLLCDDVDSGKDGSLTYIISSGNADRKFNLHQTGTKADIKSAGKFDFDNLKFPKSYSLEIRINDGGTPPLTVSVNLDITLTPVNEFDPQFRLLPPFIVINEDTAVGTMVLALKPFDEDVDNNQKPQKTKVTLTSSTTPSMFYVDEITGKIYLRHALDFETSPFHSVVLQITDVGQPPQRMSKYSLNITVHNVNEHPPTCPSQVYTVKVKEDTSVGTTLIKLDCTDLESPQLIYRFHKGDHKKFTMEHHGHLKLKKEIDTDKEDNFWPLEIEVRDKGVPRLDTFITVNIFVEDVDDNKPIWHPANNGSYSASVPENSGVGTFVTMVTALDEDRPGTDHSTIKYTIEDITTIFTMESDTGKLMIASPDLDRETKAVYTLAVSAHSSIRTVEKIFGTVTITIQDENDNQPIFSEALYSESASEDTTINTVLLRVRATDKDEGKNGKISYSIHDGNMEDGCRMSVDKKSGKISTDSELDFERKHSCILTVIASDGGSKSLMTSATVIISVKGVNEHSPVFVRQSYTVSFPEDTAVGTSLVQVEATDDDRGDDGDILYSVTSQPGIVTIDKYNGIVRLMSSLDRETTGSYLIEINVVDQSRVTKRTGTTTFTLVVDDVNEMAPSCKTIGSSLLSSPIKVGDFVYKVDCLDNDVGTNGDLSYSITNGNTNSDFTIDSQGNVVVSKLPSKSNYRLEISIFDQGSPPLQTIVYLHINVLGAPEFSNLPDQIDVNENEDIGAVIFTVKTKTASGNSRFSIKSGNTDGVFGVDGVTGNIYVASTLDREKKQSYSLTIIITDNIVKLSAKSTLKVSITDANDNTPKFSNSFYEFSVVENISPQTAVGQVFAADADIGDNGDLLYIIDSGNAANTFSISKDGNLILNTRLDAESKVDYTLTLAAIDKGHPPLTGTTNVVIIVKDFDEFPVSFVTGTRSTYTIAENTPLGAPVFVLQAKDTDKDARMLYKIIKGNDGSFIIKEDSGEIILGRYIDRESVPEYNLTVVADNNIGDSTSTLLTVSVSDVNDNDPFCQQHFLSVNVDESEAIGNSVAGLHCDDKDINENANLIYSITSGNTGNAFRLNGNKMVISTSLDSANVNNYLVGIEVKDQGTPPRSASVVVAVNVVPVYRSPKLYKSKVQLNVSEGTNIGTVIFDVDATVDGATEGTLNTPGDLEYILQSGFNARNFAVDLYTGEVIITSMLDREIIDHYNLNIKCTNIYNRKLYQTLTLQVDVLDINDHAPLFSSAAYIFLVDEDASLNSIAGQVSARDDDIKENAELEYSFAVGESLKTFSIESQSGMIRVNSTLNASIKKTYIFSVAVIDNGRPNLSSTAKVMIKLNDLNNNEPRFQQSVYNVDISESVQIGDNVYQLQADDLDDGSNGRITYDIESGNDEMKFQINLANGTLSMSDTLDRETTDSYSLEIIAQDSGVPSHTSTATLQINVIDINDNTPIFSRAIYDVKIDRYINSGTVITTVHATDLDKNLNAQLDYFIIDGNDENYFLIDIRTGDVKTVGPLYMAKDYHSLKIRVADNGYPKNTATSMLNIAIYPPVINTGSHFEFIIPENASVGEYVGTVIPDGIHGHQGKALFTIVGGNSLRVFEINKNNGIIRTEKLLDREKVHEYVLTILIEDSVNSKTSYHKLAQVTVADINDNTPLFEVPYRTIFVVENSPIGLAVTQFNVTDRDIDNNGNITLLIDPGDPLANSLFEIDVLESNLVLKTVPDYEMITDFTFFVYAMDGGSPSRTATAEIVANIIDVKDTKPFDDVPASYFSLECPASAKNGDRLKTFSPHDFGIYQSLGDPVMYLTMNKGGVFDIDPATGQLLVQNQKYLYENARYVMWGAVQVQMNNTWKSAAGIIRIDTLIPNEHLVVIEHDVSVGIVEAQRNKLRYALQDLFPTENRVGLWQVNGDNSLSGRRRLLSTGSRTTMYVVKDRTTDSIEGIERQKTFMSQKEILQVVSQSDDGTPAYTLKSKAFSTFPVDSVYRYYEDAPESPAWHETTVGIAVISIILISLAMLAVILILYFYCTRNIARSGKSSKRVMNFPSASDMLSDNQDELIEDYSYSPHLPPFKPWNGSCTSINGTQSRYLTRTERWKELLENAGFGLHSLRKPIGPPRPYQHELQRTNSDLTQQKKLNPWIFKYGVRGSELDIPVTSLTGYGTRAQNYH